MAKLELLIWMPFALAFLLSMGNQSSSQFIPADNYLLACGSSVNVTFQGRNFFVNLSMNNDELELESQKSVAVTSDSSSPASIYQSARIFQGRASYIFTIEQLGQHWIRLYFSPLPEFHQNMSSASITAIADGVVLLNNFSFMEYGGSNLIKEYAIDITSPTLALTFIPSANSLVFVNAIEVVSIAGDHGIYAINNTSVHSLSLSKFALETVYRLDVGDESLTTRNDDLGRDWESDEKYMASNSRALNVSVDPEAIQDNPRSVTHLTAPKWVYATAKAMADARSRNLSWVFPVNPNNNYFVRVHFWDIISNLENYAIFILFIDGAYATRVDLYSQESYSYIYERHHMDFVVSTRGNNLTVTVAPDRTANSTNATMNGLEIMKIVTEVRTLDGRALAKLSVILGSIFGATAFLVLFAVTSYYLKTCRSQASSRAITRSCRLFTLQEISEATNNFDECLLLGEGGFGKVYEGTMNDGEKVAIKVANAQSRQGLREFRNEIELLSKLSHKNLVSLMGYCNEETQMILVYEFLANGSLSGHLYGTNFLPLSWKQRLEICIGTAKGLHYLHTGAAQGIIHRDVKTANILLNENFVPKVADFGISRKGPPLEKSHVTTLVKGSFGYLDPEYFRTKYLTEKSDVFSFGMVLMEVICGKPAIDDTRPTEHINLARWASSCQDKDTFYEIIDPNLMGKVNLDSLNKVRELAWKCLEESRTNRPPMGYVLCELEDALHIELASRIQQVSMDCAIDVVVENGIKDEKEQ
ncbi:LOW QUALITY PROTEIN: receptor-like protein kinase THESEUS 1 [Prosopis cineraria]|uniref:LOW QUALITY PROTEIN: receptor-like protein kinase THESEUS 1 n=1 Tax=Prosopis cineraria TaxID=364024 RepID=UPI00240F6173|nr:LOW QUALITY PROTEIN: receptor-like protein kinase THESEUS 1 [Prosopis cineraria]